MRACAPFTACLLAAGLVWPVRGLADDVQFTRDVIPVLTKAGCNAGSCHGSFEGRGGFRLSLWGFDPAADFEALTKEARGRRISPAAPRDSLLLRKPSGRTPHGGGIVLKQDAPAYALLAQWIEAGCPGPAPDDAVLTQLEVSPPELLLAPGASAPLFVVAHWSDGSQRDVTGLALYDSAALEIAEAGKQGNVAATGRGRTAVTVRYSGLVRGVTVTVPFARIEDYPEIPRNNFIDELADAERRKVGVLPAALCDDATFLRRASFDLTGTLPAPDEVRAFLADSSPDKRAKLVDALLERSEYVDFWSLRWADLLRAHRRTLGDKGLASFQTWLRDEIRQNRPADEIVRQLLTAKGNMYNNGPVAFYFVDQTPADLAETTAQIFLGVRFQCARCHHHPFESWSQEDYYGLAAFFSRVVRKDTKEDGRFGGAQAVMLSETGSVKHPGTGLDVAPRFPGRQPLDTSQADDARELLADWMLARENPWFAKNIVNRYWGFVFGRGLVHPIDDLRDTNPASHPALLDALADDVAQHEYDLKHLLRTIANSRTYQLAAELTPERDAQGVFLTHHVPRRLPAELLLDAVNRAAGTTESFPDLPAGTRAIELPDPSVPSDFLDIFGRPGRNTTCTCERQNGPDLRQALHMANNEELQKKLAAGQGRVALLAASAMTNEHCIEELYLAALTRLPTAEEQSAAQEFLTAAPDRRECLEDLLWTLINSAEFSFSR